MKNYYRKRGTILLLRLDKKDGTHLWAKIDEIDAPLILGYRWSPVDGRGHTTYVGVTGGPRLHRLLLGNPKGLVDHINGDGLDNRRCNLRVATHRRNQFNRHGKVRSYAGLPPTSQFTGVSWDKQLKKWHARITSHGRTKHLGYFDEEKSARDAYIREKGLRDKETV